MAVTGQAHGGDAVARRLGPARRIGGQHEQHAGGCAAHPYLPACRLRGRSAGGPGASAASATSGRDRAGRARPGVRLGCRPLVLARTGEGICLEAGPVGHPGGSGIRLGARALGSSSWRVRLDRRPLAGALVAEEHRVRNFLRPARRPSKPAFVRASPGSVRRSAGRTPTPLADTASRLGHAAATGRHPRALPRRQAMNQLTPAAVHLPSCLRGARENGRGVHSLVVGTVASWDVLVAPSHVEDLAQRVRPGLAARAIRARQRRTVSDVFRHAPGPTRR
jgi:hypothetical protein